MADFRPRPNIKRGQYEIPDPYTGKPRLWTRVTSFASTLDDTFGLNRWSQRLVAVGLSKRADLAAMVAVTKPEDSKTLDSIVEDAKAAAGAGDRAALGTAFHAWTESSDAGECPMVPEVFTEEAVAYVELIRRYNIRFPVEHIERVVVIPELGLAGTYDRLGLFDDDSLLRVADIKSGRDMYYSWLKTSIQLAVYSRATHIFNADTRTFELMPPVNQDVGNVFHVPVGGKGKATCYDVDLAAGWEAALLARDVRRWRNRHNLASESLLPVPVSAYAARYPEMIRSAESLDELRSVWADAMSRGEWTEELKALVSDRRESLGV